MNEKRLNILVDCRFDLDNVKIRGFASSISIYINEKRRNKTTIVSLSDPNNTSKIHFNIIHVILKIIRNPLRMCCSV